MNLSQFYKSVEEFSHKLWFDERMKPGASNGCPFSPNQKRADSIAKWAILIKDWWKYYDSHRDTPENQTSEKVREYSRIMAYFYFSDNPHPSYKDPFATIGGELVYTRTAPEDIINWLRKRDKISVFDAGKKALFYRYIWSFLDWHASEKDPAIEETLRYLTESTEDDPLTPYISIAGLYGTLVNIKDFVTIYFSIALRAEEVLWRALTDQELKIIKDHITRHIIFISSQHNIVWVTFFDANGEDTDIWVDKNGALEIQISDTWHQENIVRSASVYKEIGTLSSGYTTEWLLRLYDAAENTKNMHPSSIGDTFQTQVKQLLRGKARIGCPALHAGIMHQFVVDCFEDLENLYRKIAA